MEHRKPKMKDFLAESLELLMQEKPFDKITIKQICDRAGVIRATFYNHFGLHCGRTASWGAEGLCRFEGHRACDPVAV